MAEIFATSSNLLNKFTLTLSPNFFDKWSVKDLPNIPMRNMRIQGNICEIQSFPDIMRLKPVFKKYNKAITSVEFNRLFKKCKYEIACLLNVLKNLTHLTMQDVYIEDDDDGFLFKHSKLKSLTISNDSNSQLKCQLKMFKFNKSIEKLKFELALDGDYDDDITAEEFNKILITFPRLKHYIHKEIMGPDPSLFCPAFPAKLEILETSLSIDSNFLNFLRSQKENLKDLILSDVDSYCCEYYKAKSLAETEAILNDFAFNEMNLRNFRLENVDIIVNYQKQPVIPRDLNQLRHLSCQSPF